LSNNKKDLEEIAEIISIAIARENSSVRYYREASSKAVTESVKKMFSILEKQEMEHETELRAQLHEIEAQIELEKKKKRNNSRI